MGCVPPHQGFLPSMAQNACPGSVAAAVLAWVLDPSVHAHCAPLIIAPRDDASFLRMDAAHVLDV
jgi:hypothetical protein